MLAEKTPASFVAFDAARARRRVAGGPAVLASAARGWSPRSAGSTGPTYLTRTTTDTAEAETWFEQFEGAGLDGVVAKPMGSPYQQNARTMLKIKHERTADVVLAGYRLHKTSTPERPLLGSLLLGLYADGEAPARRGLRLVHRGPPRRADRGAAAARVPDRRAPLGQVAGVGDRQPRPGARARRAGGARARTCPSRRCVPSACSRSKYDAHGGSAVPAHRAVQALAARP